MRITPAILLPAKPPPPTVLTVGHSTHPIETLIEMLRAHGVQRLVDVRTIPRSRRNPQFNTEALTASLPAAGIAYTHLPGLGGLRKARPDSINAGWRNDSFRGYADYMQTPEFEAALRELLGLAAKERTAVMCAESAPWRCHRSLIADALAARGGRVLHIMSPTKADEHELRGFARVEGERVTYPAEGGTLWGENGE